MSKKTKKTEAEEPKKPQSKQQATVKDKMIRTTDYKEK